MCSSHIFTTSFKKLSNAKLGSQLTGLILGTFISSSVLGQESFPTAAVPGNNGLCVSYVHFSKSSILEHRDRSMQ